MALVSAPSLILERKITLTSNSIINIFWKRPDLPGQISLLPLEMCMDAQSGIPFPAELSLLAEMRRSSTLADLSAFGGPLKRLIPLSIRR